jgi:hypothetical protein
VARKKQEHQAFAKTGASSLCADYQKITTNNRHISKFGSEPNLAGSKQLLC